MTIQLPDEPQNNQTFVLGDVVYRYNSSKTRWEIVENGLDGTAGISVSPLFEREGMAGTIQGLTIEGIDYNFPSEDHGIVGLVAGAERTVTTNDIVVDVDRAFLYVGTATLSLSQDNFDVNAPGANFVEVTGGGVTSWNDLTDRPFTGVNLVQADYNGDDTNPNRRSGGFGGLRVQNNLLEVDTNNLPLEGFGNIAGVFNEAGVNGRSDGDVMRWRPDPSNTQWGGLWTIEELPTAEDMVSTIPVVDYTREDFALNEVVRSSNSIYVVTNVALANATDDVDNADSGFFRVGNFDTTHSIFYNVPPGNPQTLTTGAFEFQEGDTIFLFDPNDLANIELYRIRNITDGLRVTAEVPATDDDPLIPQMIVAGNISFPLNDPTALDRFRAVMADRAVRGDRNPFELINFDAATTDGYVVNDLVIAANRIYRRNGTAYPASTVPNDARALAIAASPETGLGSTYWEELSADFNLWNPNTRYNTGSIVISNNVVYRRNETAAPTQADSTARPETRTGEDASEATLWVPLTSGAVDWTFGISYGENAVVYDGASFYRRNDTAYANAAARNIAPASTDTPPGSTYWTAINTGSSGAGTGTEIITAVNADGTTGRIDAEHVQFLDSQTLSGTERLQIPNASFGVRAPNLVTFNESQPDLQNRNVLVGINRLNNTLFGTRIPTFRTGLNNTDPAIGHVSFRSDNNASSPPLDDNRRQIRFQRGLPEGTDDVVMNTTALGGGVNADQDTLTFQAQGRIFANNGDAARSRGQIALRVPAVGFQGISDSPAVRFVQQANAERGNAIIDSNNITVDLQFNNNITRLGQVPFEAIPQGSVSAAASGITLGGLIGVGANQIDFAAGTDTSSIVTGVTRLSNLEASQFSEPPTAAQAASIALVSSIDTANNRITLAGDRPAGWFPGDSLNIITEAAFAPVYVPSIGRFVYSSQAGGSVTTTTVFPSSTTYSDNYRIATGDDAGDYVIQIIVAPSANNINVGLQARLRRILAANVASTDGTEVADNFAGFTGSPPNAPDGTSWNAQGDIVLNTSTMLGTIETWRAYFALNAENPTTGLGRFFT